jgi:hypothetical protein
MGEAEKHWRGRVSDSDSTRRCLLNGFWFQLESIGRTLAADTARLRAHEVPMRFIAFSGRLYEHDRVLIILHRS